MCDPFTMSALAIASFGVGVAKAVSAQQSRESQKDLAKANATLQRAQVRTNLQDEGEANTQKAFELSRQALAARGVAQASNLGDRSVRAIARSINFDLGQDKAIIEKNRQIAAQAAAAKLSGIDITLASQKGEIGDTSGVTLGLEIAGAGMSSLMNTGSLAMSAGMFAPPATPPPTQLDASTYLDEPIA